MALTRTVLSLEKSTFTRLAMILGSGVAVLWPGECRAQYYFADLNPGGYSSSGIYGSSGGYLMGWGEPSGGNQQHAVAWRPGSSPVDLNPVGFDASWGNGTDGQSFVGYGSPTGSGTSHALLWNGLGGSVIDLNPIGSTASSAHEVEGSHVVGSANLGGTGEHALLWNGSADDFVDLNPSSDYSISTASTLLGSQQAGSVYLTSASRFHASLWEGTAASFVDLHPTGFDHSAIQALTDTSQIGWASWVGGLSHAMLWSGSAPSSVDLNPSGFANSVAYDGFGGLQVGFAQVAQNDGRERAMVWQGSAASAVDLSTYLPAGAFYRSWASTIDENGDIYGYAVATNNGSMHAVVWSTHPVPEPMSLTALVALSGLAAWRRRRRA